MGNRPGIAPTLRSVFVATAFAAMATSTIAAEPLPNGFVYLRDVDPTIVQEMRYAGPDNFVGRIVDGYEAGACILLKAAAEDLKRAQALLKLQQLSLKVYDCYRPARAVAHFGRWAEDASDQQTKAAHYPRLDKSQLMALGWIARVSGHSRGGSVDITVVPLGAGPQSGGSGRRCDAPLDKAEAAGALDFGTRFDCFDELSATRHPAIKGEAARNRARLVAIMRRVGFANYAREWWHFDHVASDKPPVQDFPVRHKGAGLGSFRMLSGEALACRFSCVSKRLVQNGSGAANCRHVAESKSVEHRRVESGRPSHHFPRCWRTLDWWAHRV